MSVEVTNFDGEPEPDPLDYDDPEQEVISPQEENLKRLIELALQPDFTKALESAIAYCSEHQEKLYNGETN